MRKKRIVLISEKKGSGFYVEHFGGRKLIAEKKIRDRLANKVANMIFKDPTLKEHHAMAKASKKQNYEWLILFEDNPKMLNVLRRHKASGLEKEGKGITCPLYMAVEIK